MEHVSTALSLRLIPRSVGIASIAALAVVLTLVLVLPGPQRAQAHDTPYNCVGVYYGNYPNTTLRGVACTEYNHHMLDGCDREPDGLRARAWWWLYGVQQSPGSWDPNGANSGCAHDTYSFEIDAHLICVEQPVGCSGWVES
jgi:hypothetical protein